MANNANNVRVGITGAVYYAKNTQATAPTGAGSDVSDWLELGYASEDGVELSMPDAGDSKSLKAWQNGATVRTLHSPSEDSPQVTVTLIETKLETVELAFGVTVERKESEGTFVINTNAARDHVPLILDVVDGGELFRLYAPHAIVTSIDTITFKGDEAIGYAITIDCEFDEALGGNARVWMTGLASTN